MPLKKWRTAAKAGAATVVAGSSAGTVSWAAYRHLMSQATSARGVIGRNTARPPEADGVYGPGDLTPERWRFDSSADIHLMVFGDSTAAGVGCTVADEVPGVYKNIDEVMRAQQDLVDAADGSVEILLQTVDFHNAKLGINLPGEIVEIVVGLFRVSPVQVILRPGQLPIHLSLPFGVLYLRSRGVIQSRLG